jgi:hypothetical protein
MRLALASPLMDVPRRLDAGPCKADDGLGRDRRPTLPARTRALADGLDARSPPLDMGMGSFAGPDRGSTPARHRTPCRGIGPSIHRLWGRTRWTPHSASCSRQNWFSVVLGEEILVQAFELDCPVGADPHSMFDHQVSEVLAIEQNDPL